MGQAAAKGSIAIFVPALPEGARIQLPRSMHAAPARMIQEWAIKLDAGGDLVAFRPGLQGLEELELIGEAFRRLEHASGDLGEQGRLRQQLPSHEEKLGGGEKHSFPAAGIAAGPARELESFGPRPELRVDLGVKAFESRQRAFWGRSETEGKTEVTETVAGSHGPDPRASTAKSSDPPW